MSQSSLNIPGSHDAAVLEAMRTKLQGRRRVKNAIALTLSLAAMAFGLIWLVWILYTTLRLGISGLSIELFTQSTPPPNTDGGGLANAIVGSLMLVGSYIGILAVLANIVVALVGSALGAAARRRTAASLSPLTP